jgi:hypothetical protein
MELAGRERAAGFTWAVSTENVLAVYGKMMDGHPATAVSPERIASLTEARAGGTGSGLVAKAGRSVARAEGGE